MKRSIGELFSCNDGAVAPTIALSLVGLIAAGGVAFDYARLASMDTELQNAADQAALAAVSQLDGQTGACSRAAAAAVGMVANLTYMSNDGGGMAVVIQNESACDAAGKIRFYQNINKSTAATSDANAKFVEVEVDPRQAVYTLTPIVAAFRSSNIVARAFAGLDEAICNTPPLMMCNPDEPTTNANVNYPFNPTAYHGRGIRLVGNGSYEPGNFGFLQTGYGSGANALLKALGYNTPPGDCLGTSTVTTQTGVDASVMDGINTRFDIDANGNTCPGGDVNCSPSVNVRKDLVRGNSCGITGNGWIENPATTANYQDMRYRPTSAAVLPSTTTPQIMGYPRDLCHAWNDTGDCNGVAGSRIGTGDWDIQAYWRSNYGGAAYTNQVDPAIYGAQPKGYPTRYQVYRWEADDYANRLNQKTGQNSKVAYSRPVAGECLATPTAPYGFVPGTNTVDRRRISTAVLNCKALNINGHEVNQPVIKWVDLFLVEPSYSRSKCSSGSGCNTKFTDKTDLYVEVIGETQNVNAGNFQVVKKAVPYLIE